MKNQIISIAYSAFVNKGAFALLLGSGISRKTGIPTGWDITLNLIRQIAILEKEKISTTPEDWYVKRFKEEPDYSNILEKLTSTKEERINLLKPLIEPTEDEFQEGLKQPTQAHKYIAQLVSLGYIKVILTTNFDRLIENALKDLGIEPSIISNPNHIENSVPLIHSKITVIKINGDYLDTGFLNLKSELEKYDSRLEALMSEVFENFGIITCGWSAKWDLALVNSLKSSNKFRFSNFFTHLNEPDSELSELSQFRKGHLVKINDSDSFFYELHEDIVALEKNNSQHPLSPKIALERTKKYIAKEEFRIPLHELLSHVFEESFEGIESIQFPKPTMDSLKDVMHSYLKYLEPLSTILAEGVFWGKDHHDKIWVELVKRSGDVDLDKSGTNYSIWLDIRYLPCLLIRYLAGVASVANQNFKLLNSILDIEIFDRYDSKNILEMTIPLAVISKKHLNEILGQNYSSPMSELLYKYLRPFFKSVVPIDKEFDQIFNYYEIICSISFIRNSEENSSWAPVGRFGYNDGKMLQKILGIAKTQQQDFELIRGGLFKDYEEFERVVNSYAEIVKNSRFR